MKILISNLFVLSFLVSTLSAQQEYLTARPDWAGMWFNINDVDFTGFEDVRAGRADRLAWKDMEPAEGVYDFSELKSELEKALGENYYYYFVFWTGPSAGEWIYDQVPMVVTDQGTFPYYLDTDYKAYLTAFLDTLAGTIASWPKELIDHLVFIQPGFGATGDRQLYKGTPVDSQYEISTAQYLGFMQEMTIVITEAFKNRSETADIRFLWNISDYDGSEPINPNKEEEELYGKWMKENFNCQLRKQQYTIAVGYLSPNEVIQDNEQRNNFYGNTGRWGGNPEFVRGELNEGETAITPLYQLKPFLFYYWTAISGVDRGLDGWELKVLKKDYKEAYAFSHRYSFYKKPEKSPVAFIALRDILDYSDINRFPESEYGSADKSNISRVNNILSEFAEYGAGNDDMTAAIQSSQIAYLKETKGYNDCLWNVIARNNQRFITQIDANETSAGYWRVGISQTQPYGRFCRGFDVEKGKNTMYFDIDDSYFLGNQDAGVHRLKIRIIYYAEEEGSWKLNYHAVEDTIKTAVEISNEPGHGWRSEEIYIEDALLNNGGPNGADLVLQNTGGTDCKFHLIEISRDIVIPGNDSVPVSSIEIQDPGEQVLYLDETLQLVAKVAPADAGNQAVNWSSTNPDVANINGFGKISALAHGVTSIIVSSFDGSISDTIEITVIDPDFGQLPYGKKKRTIPGYIEAEEYDVGGQGISFNDVTGKEGGLNFRPEDPVDFRVAGIDTVVTKTENGEWLEYTIDVEEGMYDLTLHYVSAWPEDCQVVFTIDGEEIARFSSLKAAATTGDWETILTATIQNIQLQGGTDKILKVSIEETRGNVQLDAYEFIVSEIVNVDEVNIGNCPSTDLTAGQQYQLNVEVLPSDAFNSLVSWSTSDASVAAVDDFGVVSAIAEGVAVITVTSDDGGNHDQCNINVSRAYVPVSGIALFGCPPGALPIDSTVQLGFEIMPENADDQSVAWSSSDASVASVDENGLVTAISPGTAGITVSSGEGSYTDECSIVVETGSNVQAFSYALKSVKMYPNPFTGKLYFELSDGGVHTSISIYNTLGELLISEETHASLYEMDVSHLPNEKFFIVRVVSGRYTACFKAVGNRLN